jgi:hypothetical protein
MSISNMIEYVWTRGQCFKYFTAVIYGLKLYIAFLAKLAFTAVSYDLKLFIKLAFSVNVKFFFFCP